MMNGNSRLLGVMLCSALLAACGGSGGGGGDSDSEPEAGCGAVVGDGNETFDTADPIAFNAPVNASVNGQVIEASGEPTGDDPFDIFLFTVPNAGNYDVTLSWGDAAIDLDLEVYDLAQDPVDPIRRSTETNTDMERIDDVLGTGGQKLHILVLAWNTGCNAQNYTLTVQ